MRDTLLRILEGRSDANLRFTDLANLLVRLGFEERIKGSHHIFTSPGIAEILNLQARGAMAKPYQVRQVRNLILRYKLGDSSE
jgi:hypothetical protein